MSISIRIREITPPHDPGRMWVAEVDDVRVGHLFVADERGRLDSDVHPGWQRRGIAKALYRHAIDVLGSLTAREYEQSYLAHLVWCSLQREGYVVTKNGRYLTLSSPQMQGVVS